MKSILITAATDFELDFEVAISENLTIEKLVTGIGIPNTIVNLMSHLQNNKYDLIVNIGIAGHFNDNLKIGDVVQIQSDTYADLGAEDKDGNFLTLKDLDLGNSATKVSFQNELIFPEIKTVLAITVNKSSGHAKSILQKKRQFNADIETMESAAIAHVCNALHLKYVCIRSISNKVEARNKDNWDIPLALKELHSEVKNNLDSKIFLNLNY
jgi:futalosine hydrolase